MSWIHIRMSYIRSLQTGEGWETKAVTEPSSSWSSTGVRRGIILWMISRHALCRASSLEREMWRNMVQHLLIYTFNFVRFIFGFYYFYNKKEGTENRENGTQDGWSWTQAYRSPANPPHIYSYLIDHKLNFKKCPECQIPIDSVWLMLPSPLKDFTCANTHSNVWPCWRV